MDSSGNYDINELIDNIKNKNLGMTRHSEYSDLWYTDNKNKICMTFTPKAGCSTSFQQYLDLVGLLEDGLKFSGNNIIHHYRCNLFIYHICFTPLDELINQKYTFIKFIINPYIRAVSVFNAVSDNQLTFRQFLKQIINGNEFSYHYKYHMQEQYVKGEEEFITKYIKINENQKHTLQLHDGTLYEINLNKFTSKHHHPRRDYKLFCGDTPKHIILSSMPQNYKFFYDVEIKNLVDTIYKNDVNKYGFTFNF